MRATQLIGSTLKTAAQGYLSVPALGVFAIAVLTAVGVWGGEGGLAGSLSDPAHDDAPPYSIQKDETGWWLLSPTGERFFSFGVCCVQQGTPRNEFNPKNPPYAWWQHYDLPGGWADASLRRLKSWGFTTLGGWSDFATLRRSSEQTLGMTPVLHVGSTAGAPWWDMWDPKITGRMEQVARDQILALRDDPRLIGYYTDNEMGWWNATLFKMTLEHASTSGQRRRLLELLRETYHNNWAELLKDFEPEGIAGWPELEQRGMLYLRPGGNGIRTMRKFLGLLAERYYSLVREIIRKYDRRALILGDRYQSFYYPEVARASAAYVDAVSSNLNASWNDGTFARFYLETLHALTGKPILIGEFYMAAQNNRSGNRNRHGVYPVVTTQTERATGFANTISALARIPYVVGADWFQYFDEPGHGRGDGEDFNFGLVDVHNRPYEALTISASAFHPISLKTNPVPARPDASQGVPPAPRDPLGQFKPTLALKHWDREHGFIPPVSEFPLADLYVCWSAKAVYLGLYAQDVVEDAFYRDKRVPTGDRAEWVVSIGGSGRVIRAPVGAGAGAVVDDPVARIVNVSGLNLNVRNIAAMELPAKLFGKERFKAGDEIEIASTFFTHCRAYRVEWKGRFTLRDDR